MPFIGATPTVAQRQTGDTPSGGVAADVNLLEAQIQELRSANLALAGDIAGTVPVPVINATPTTVLAWDGTNGGTADSMGRQTVNTSQWTYEQGGGETPIGSFNRFGNWEAQIYTNSLKNVFVRNNQLHIRAFKENPQIASPVAGEGHADFSSGRIHTQGKVSVPVGSYVEAKIQMPSAPGTWPAFWAMGTNYVRNADNTANWPYCGEIDTVECFGQHRNAAGFALHMTATGIPNDTNAYTSDLYIGWDNFDSVYRDPSFDITKPNLYGFWFNGTEVRRYVNRRETFRYSQAQATASGRAWPFNQTMFLLLNLAVGGQATDGASPTSGPDKGMGAEMVVDAINIWGGVTDPAALGLLPVPVNNNTGNPRDSLVITHGEQVNSSNTGASTSLLTGGRTAFIQSGTKASPVDVTITTGNQTIVDTEYHGMVKVNAANVTFKNCIFHGHNSTTNEACVHADQPNISGAYFQDCTFLPDYPSLWINGINGHAFTLDRCDISNTVDGVGVYDTSSTTGVNKGGTNANPNYATNVVVQNTYIHDLLYWTPDPNHTNDNQTHNDGIQIQGGTGTVVKFNNVQAYYGTAGNYQPAPNANPSPSGYANVGLDCIYMGGQSGSTVTNCTITDNLFGGGYIPLNLTGGSQTTSVGSILRNKFDGKGGANVGTAKPETVLLKAAQTASYGVGTTNANTFTSTSPTYAGQEVLVRTNG